MKKMLSFAVAALFALVGAAEEVESSTITSDIENDYGQNPYGTACEMSIFKQKTATLKWCSLGTSISWYNDHPNPEVGLTHGYQDRTIEKLGLSKANFVNSGVSGARVGDPGTEPPAGSPCDIYTLEWGINDWMHGTRVGNIEVFRRRLADPNYTAEDILPNPWATFACRYATVINQIKAINPNAIIILMTPRKSYGFQGHLPNNWWTIGGADSAAEEPSYLYDYVKLIRAIAEETGYPLVDQFRYAANQENLHTLSIDVALHPNDAGFEVMANLLAPVMSKAIEKKYSITRCTHEGTTEVVAGTAATCTEAGTTDKTVCSNTDCQMVLVPSETIPALGHDWGAWTVTTPATESATGLKERTCQRTGCNEKETLVIPRVGEIIALRNIAVVTKVGELPALPSAVAGLRADGTVAGQCDVVWAEHVAPSAVGKTTIAGTATVDGAAKSVTASVRAVVEQSDADLENVVSGVPPTAAYPMSGLSYPFANITQTTLGYQVNGCFENNSLVWYGSAGTEGAYDGKFAKEVFVFDFTLPQRTTIKGFSVWHMTDSTWMADPLLMFAEVSTDNGTTWTPVAVTGGAKPKSVSPVMNLAGGDANVYKFNYELATPAWSVTNIRLKISPTGVETPEPRDDGVWTGIKISEIEVFGIKGDAGGPSEPLTADTLSALEVDNVAVQGFAPTTLSYTIEEAKVITSATSTDNMGITILPRTNGVAHVVTLSESGSTKTYTVNMPAACEHEHQTITPAVAATCTTAGSTWSVYCEDCKKYLETSEPIQALGHDWGGWTVTKEPSKTETGYREHTCQRSGCGVTEGEDIPMLADVVALRNVAVATEIGTAPTLPETVKGLNADGTLADGGYSVVWSSFDAPSAAGITTVTGTAQVNGAPMSVTAFVRAAVGVGSENLSSSAIETTEANIVKGTLDKAYLKKYLYLTTKAADPLTTSFWDDVICYGNEVEVTIEWSSPVMISKVMAYYYVSGNYQPPANVKFYNEDDVEISWTDGDGDDTLSDKSWHEWNFTAPQTLRKLRFYQKRDASQHSLFLRRVWALGGAGSVDPTTTDTLTALEVDNQSVTGFEAATCNYTVYNGTEITSATNANGNVAVTVLPKYNGSAYAVTLSETGGQTKTYTVSMPICLHEHTTTKGASAATCTVAGSTGTETCDICGAQIHGPEEIPPTGHLHTTLTGVKEATCTEDGYTGDTVCSDCNEKIASGAVIPATGHLHTTTTGEKEATCTEDGYTGDTVCSDCKETIASGTVIPKTGHQHTTVTGASDPTCTEPGSTGTETCDKCGDTIREAEEIPALGHDWSAWEITTPPTMTSTGLRERDCSRCDAHESEVIPKLADVVALRNVALVTEVGTAPTLPGKVAGLKADGTVDGEFEVTWPEVPAPTEPGVTLVTSTSTANGMTVTASVRAVVPPTGELVNIAPLASSMTVEVSQYDWKQSDQQGPEVITNGYGNVAMKIGGWNDPGGGNYRNIWNAAHPENTTTVRFAWGSSKSIRKLFLAMYDGNAHSNYILKNGSTHEVIPATSYTCKRNDDSYYKINQGEGVLFEFNEAMSLSELEVVVVASSTWVGFYEIEIWAEGGSGSVDPTSSDTLTALAVDGNAVANFAPTTYNYTVYSGAAITSAVNANDNVAVTILPKHNDVAYAVTLAEDGESTQIYSVMMADCQHANTRLDDKVDATCTKDGYTGDTVCETCGATIAKGSTVPALGHAWGAWTVTKAATYYEKGESTRECGRCDAEEHQDIDPISRKTVKWIDVDFANYADASTIADAQVDPVDGGTWAKASVDDTATVAHGDPDLAALVVTNSFLGYTAKAPTTSGRDATVKVQAKFQKPNTSDLPPALELGQTAVFVFPKGKNSCYKAYTADGWIELTGATPDFTKFVTITIEFRYEYGERLAMVKIDNDVCTPVDATSPWFVLAGSVTKLTSVSFFGAFDLGPFEGDYLTTNRGTLMYIR